MPAPVRGAFWMVLAALLFSLMNGVIRHASTELHPFEVVFFRNLFSLAVMLPLVLSRASLTTSRWRLYFTRALTGLAAMLTWFYSLSVMPMAEAMALYFTAPLFATMGAALVLGETVRARRWTAIAIGFAGVLIIVRPGASTLSWGAVAVLASAVFTAISMLQIKALARTEGSLAMTAYMVIYLTPMSLPPALAVWTTPSWSMLGWLVVLGTVISFAHLAFSQAFHLADASAMIPFDYAKLPLTALVGWIFFGETVDRWTWLGAGVIAGSTLYIAHREAVVARRARNALGTPGGGPAAEPLTARDPTTV
ncbi:MAG: EamA family transporter [Azospirillum sp.]|nr:EamA family transporter [Azospirillum sp.]